MKDSISQPSLFEMLTGHFSGGLPVEQVCEQEQLIMSVLDNIQRLLNSRRGTLSHLSDYGLTDMGQIIHGLPTNAQGLLAVLKETLLKFEPRIKNLDIQILSNGEPEKLGYALVAELYDQGTVRFGTEFMPDGGVLVKHLKSSNLYHIKNHFNDKD